VDPPPESPLRRPGLIAQCDYTAECWTESLSTSIT
jgi:hypothetical protein